MRCEDKSATYEQEIKLRFASPRSLILVSNKEIEQTVLVLINNERDIQSRLKIASKAATKHHTVMVQFQHDEQCDIYMDCHSWAPAASNLQLT